MVQFSKFITNDHNLFLQKNPRTLPILDDNGFLLGESNAILQYLAEQYGKDDTLYPKDPKARAVVNHRLCFNLSTYYPCVAHYTLGPVILDNPKSSVDEHKMDIALDNFHDLLKLLMKDYVAGDTVTIADFQLVATTMCLQFAKVNLRRWPLVKNWYNSYKFAHPTLWKIVEAGMKELDGFRAPSEKKEEHKPLSHLLLPLPN
uniref:Putative glutathione S-transferase uncharacterized class member 2 n=1 Tax=Leptinotarsa decemlineata TaxID=7539 RepID=A0A1P8PEX9_LEPDE|nr:glutathione S-transferase D1-like [Leptinotarsa decemlineata]APX61056.1 putative glutathione S-transferase uncharacterized class member 2 [Leptinotarsa decemlineata]